MKTQAQFAEEILEQCQYGTSVSNLMQTLGEYRKQEIAEACKKQREICAKTYTSHTDTLERMVYNSILNAPSPLEGEKK